MSGPTLAGLMLGLRFAAHKRGYILPTLNITESPDWIEAAIDAYGCADEICLAQEHGTFRDVFAKVCGREFKGHAER